MPEFDIIRRYFKEQTPHNDTVRIGIGDDAAVLTVAENHELVVAVDTLVAGVHFPTTTPAYDIGYKSLAVNLSDLAAMGATPRWMTLALTMPAAEPEWLKGFSAGLFCLAQQYGIELVGGDTTQGPLTISVQIGGIVKRGKAMLRTGARVDDLILVTGTLGDAARALQLIQSKIHNMPPYYLERLNRPQPRLTAGQQLAGLASACIDISDGLYADLAHITASSGVGAVIELEHLPLSPILRDDALSLTEKYRLALTGGDDYELCFTVSEEKLGIVQSVLAGIDLPWAVIGKITAQVDIQIHSEHGNEVVIDSLGYEHFS